MSKKRILITGAGSGFGEGAAIGLAQNGHDVIAGAQIWPQVTSLRQKVKSLGLNNLRVEKLDLLHPYDVDHVLKWDIDILFSNAGIGEVHRQEWGRHNATTGMNKGVAGDLEDAPKPFVALSKTAQSRHE
jgi:NADP-dependent 3-hydroxy acid dehydrogenase YdfG